MTLSGCHKGVGSGESTILILTRCHATISLIYFPSHRLRCVNILFGVHPFGKKEQPDYFVGSRPRYSFTDSFFLGD